MKAKVANRDQGQASRRLYLKGEGEFFEVVQADVSLRPFDAADVGAVKAGDPQGCGKVVQRREQLPESAARVSCDQPCVARSTRKRRARRRRVGWGSEAMNGERSQTSARNSDEIHSCHSEPPLGGEES